MVDPTWLLAQLPLPPMDPDPGRSLSPLEMGGIASIVVGGITALGTQMKPVIDGYWADRRHKREVETLGLANELNQANLEIKLLKDTWPFQHPKFALGPFQGAIDDMVEEVWPGLFDLTGRVPLIVEAVPAIVEAKLTDQYPDADLGQVVRLKVRIQYAAPVV